MDKKVSVIIPTYNRANFVKKTVNSFIEQSLPKENYEILVVDNDSSDLTKKVVNEIIKAHEGRPHIRYIFEPRPGVHFARNRGAKEADNEILYFTDDDMIADRDLLVEVLKVFDFDYKIGAATGVVLPKFEVNPPQWMIEHDSSFVLSLKPKKEEELIISSKSMGVYSCHYLIKKDVLFEAGGFNPENTKGEWIGDGEAGLNRKLKKLNYKFVFTAKSIIYHMIPKERLTQRYTNKKFANQGAANSYTNYQENRYSEKQLFLLILKHIFRAFSFLVLSTFLFLVRNSLWHLRLAKVFYWISRIKYDFKLIKSSSWREFVLKTDWINE